MELLEVPDIGSLLPHDGPMVLLDRLLSVDEESLSAEVMIRPDSMFCREAGVGGWVGVEYMAQAVAAHAGHAARLRGEAVKIGFLLGSRRYECSRPVFAIGSLLRVHVRCVLMSENGLGSFECRIDDGDGQAACASITVFQPGDVRKFLEGTIE